MSAIASTLPYQLINKLAHRNVYAVQPLVVQRPICTGFARQRCRMAEASFGDSGGFFVVKRYNFN